ncbi:oxidoreductase [Olivibacter domesticus]|uniref:NAD(P)-dependent dehydrogenase, short-chain alcohol dehydrogenase family n=1 Tax=Olivibacter domesticus TaxID=407022 RepID=A0A1H7ZFJ5_OLID1|nr:oxidoreductase [Olivibacter domesticus]SEM56308.1 NAD(P)-dependent dehydrogenase, short-chain alcohol dehydrogenase family [Olivibacter domesticus]
MWTTKNMPDLSGKIAVVTGANTGIGFETAKALYEAGATVTIAARDERKIKEAIERIKTAGKGRGSLEVGILNLASLTSVKHFANRFISQHKSLDLLINNAGVMIPPASKTEDGFELQFGVNFLGHFALTGLFFTLLKRADHARVVTLSSGAATLAEGIDFENLRLEKPYDEWREYAVSKLADILFTKEFDRRLQANGSNILSVAAHPGVTRTDLQRHIPADDLDVQFARFDTVMDPWQGALPSLFAATDASVKGSDFYGPDGENEYAGYPALSKHSTGYMHDKVLATNLWEYAEKETGVHYFQ